MLSTTSLWPLSLFRKLSSDVLKAASKLLLRLLQRTCVVLLLGFAHFKTIVSEHRSCKWKKMNKKTSWDLEEGFFWGSLLLGGELEEEHSSNATVSGEAWLAFACLLEHEAAGLLCDNWQDKSSKMPCEINENHPLKWRMVVDWEWLCSHKISEMWILPLFSFHL